MAGKNNFVDNTNPWCFPCNDAHALRKCLRGNLQQKVAKQWAQGILLDLGNYSYSSLEVDDAMFTTQMQDMSLEQEFEIALEHTLFSWMEEDDVVFVNDAFASKPQVQSNYNTRSKRRFTGELVCQISKPHVTFKKGSDKVATTSFPQRSRENFQYKPKDFKVLAPLTMNVVEQLKKAPTNVSL